MIIPAMYEGLQLLLYDALFVGVFLLALLPLATYRHAAFSVLKRNFAGYFFNPTGYVFLCIFVALTSFFAFWPHEFFNANLANLDQLNNVIPLVMLLYIPAITMSVWAEERRQGTDELLLTLPAGDFDIVIGKFLAAASVFSASLLFSQLANYIVLVSLSMGELDTGLFFATYLGYWMIGLAMLSIGMVASFVTSNLTVGFVLGVLFNVPLALAAYADLIIPDPEYSRLVGGSSIGARFDDFGRGVISLSSVVYFIMATAVGLYFSIVLIGKRHWSGGKDGDSMLGHYMARCVAIVLAALSLGAVFTSWDVLRYDATEGKVASLSQQTKELIRKLPSDHPIRIEAFISAEVPETYVQTKYDLVSLLKEFDKASDKIKLNLHANLELFSDEAANAEERYGITARPVTNRARGGIKDEDMIMGAVFRCGLDKVVVPFFDYGVPVEYELIRSINTVAKTSRAKLGVVRTDAQLHGGFSFAGGRPQQIPRQPLIQELEKQYDVEEVDPMNPIEPGKYDVLLAVQPSSLPPEAFNNVVAAIEAGQPTAVFEDPRPVFMQQAPGTGDQKRAPGGGGMMGMGGGGAPMPKGDIQKLWATLGVRVDGERGIDRQYHPNLVWQKYNPYPNLNVRGLLDEWIFASNNAGDNSISPASQVTSGLDEILFPVPGYIKKRNDSKYEFTPLVMTGTVPCGVIPDEQFRQNSQDPVMLRAMQGGATSERYILAAHIRGKPPADDGEGDEKKDAKDESKEDAQDESKEDAKEDAKGDAKGDADAEPWKSQGLNVIYVADIDLMSGEFLRIRARPDEMEDMRWNFENVTFILNVVDELSTDDDYIQIRKRKPKHYTLAMVEYHANKARKEEVEANKKYHKDFDDAVKKAEEEINKKVQKLKEELDRIQQDPNATRAEVVAKLQAHQFAEEQARRRLQVQRQKLTRDRDKSIKAIRREVDSNILRIQNQFKFWAIVIPPIPPLLIGIIVWVVRLLREREGVTRSRLR